MIARLAYPCAVTLLCLAICGPSHAESCRIESFKGASYIVCSFNPTKDDLRIYWRDDDGKPYRTFAALADGLKAQGKSLTLAMNGGMYQAELRPVGLYTENGRELTHANTAVRTGAPSQIPNSYKKPNGVFFYRRWRSGHPPDGTFLAEKSQTRFTMQSGPMLDGGQSYRFTPHEEVKMADPKTYYFNLPRAARPSNVKLREEWFPDIKAAALRTSKSRGRDPIKGVNTIVIHATAGSSSAGAASVIFNGTASFHWLVPDENEPQHGHFVWATCYESRAAFHVRVSVSHPKINGGQKDINRISLGIEIVNAQVSSDTFSDWQVEATAGIVRYAWAKYPNLEHVVSHAMLDPSRRTDPGKRFPWEIFKRLVLEAKEDPLPKLVAMARYMPAGSCAGLCCMDKHGSGVETA